MKHEKQVFETELFPVPGISYEKAIWYINSRVRISSIKLVSPVVGTVDSINKLAQVIILRDTEPFHSLCGIRLQDITEFSPLIVQEETEVQENLFK